MLGYILTRGAIGLALSMRVARTRLLGKHVIKNHAMTTLSLAAVAVGGTSTLASHCTVSACRGCGFGSKLLGCATLRHEAFELIALDKDRRAENTAGKSLRASPPSCRFQAKNALCC